MRDPRIPLDKGAILSESRIAEHIELYKQYFALFTAYPDRFIDLITPKDSSFQLFFYQRLYLRACMRYSYVYITAGRGSAKTFLAVLAIYLRCIFQPGTKQFLCAPGKGQGMDIAAEKITEIWNEFPLLKKEIIRENMSKATVHLWFRNGSEFSIVAALDSQRGGRRSGGLIDEVRDHDAELLNQIVLPLMTKDRRMVGGMINQYEPQHAQIYSTSASSKSSFAYEKLLEIIIKAILSPEDNFVLGFDVRIPIMHGLVSQKHIQDQRVAGTFKEGDFAREYLSIYTGGSSDSWFNYGRLLKYRTVVNSEEKCRKKIVGYADARYLLSVDVARLSAQTVISVLKFWPNQGRFTTRLVNMIVLEKEHFEQQAIVLKQLAEQFQVEEIVIDGTGLGVGLIDFMVRQNVDEKGNVYPLIGVMNDADYNDKQPKDCTKLIYVIKATALLNSEIHSTCFTEVMGGKVRFLIREQEAKQKLLATKKGRKMPPEQRIARLLPYEMTSRLIDEMTNLKAKPDVQGISLEKINTRLGKDKFSSFEYGVWRIKAKEDEYFRGLRKKNTKATKMVFFTRR